MSTLVARGKENNSTCIPVNSVTSTRRKNQRMTQVKMFIHF